jgi:two-component system sensor histidine kinase AtoS
VEIHRVLEESSEMAYHQGKSEQVDLKKEFDDAVETISADAEQLKQIFLNLILNSLEATPAQGQVTIASRKQEEKVVISITDTGNGIPAGIQHRIFDPFFTTKESGTGLGLSIARKIIEAHQGSISVRSPVQEGRGTEFIVELPL